MNTFSYNKKKPYREKLSKDAKDRYLAKIGSIGNADPS